MVVFTRHNGSGKSTLAKLLNAQITPTDGEIEGSIATVSISISGILAVILIPLIINFI